jgi:serine/threonine protein kinase
MTAELRGQGAAEYRFVSAANGLSGWVRKDLPEKFLAEFIRDPDGLMNHSSSLTVKDGPKTKVVRHTLQIGGGVRFNAVIKRFRYGAGLRRLGFLFSPSPAVRCLRGALLLQAKGILVPRPLAVLEYRGWKRLGTSYYVSEEVGDSHSLQEFWRSVIPALPRKKRPEVRRSVLRDLARLLARLHSMKIYHRDLKTSNILIQRWNGAARRLVLIDLDRVRERSRLPLSKRIKNLLQVRQRWRNPRLRIFFLMRYAEGCCASKKDAKALVRRILSRGRIRRARRGQRKRSVRS